MRFLLYKEITELKNYLEPYLIGASFNLYWTVYKPNDTLFSKKNSPVPALGSTPGYIIEEYIAKIIKGNSKFDSMFKHNTQENYLDFKYKLRKDINIGFDVKAATKDYKAYASQIYTNPERNINKVDFENSYILYINYKINEKKTQFTITKFEFGNYYKFILSAVKPTSF